METLSKPPTLVLIRGAGDLGSGVAYRLRKSGFLVVMTELADPLLVRRAVSFGNAIFEADGVTTVEGMLGRLVEIRSAVWLAMRTEEIPVVIDTDGVSWRDMHPTVVVDARVAKRNIDTKINDAFLVIGLGPGFTPKYDCHAAIETNRGHRLGRVLWDEVPEPNTGIAERVAGRDTDRVLRAPEDGYVKPHAVIGDFIEQGQVIAAVNDEPIIAAFGGVLRGLIHERVWVQAGTKIGDLDPRGEPANCFTISDKALAIGGGVLEGILSQGIHPMTPIDLAQRDIDAFT